MPLIPGISQLFLTSAKHYAKQMNKQINSTIPVTHC